jgi:drug/metabolite transporter (DMT)-like permease
MSQMLYPAVAACVAIMWSLWLFIGQIAGVNGGWFIATVTLGNFLAVLALSLQGMTAQVPSARAIAITCAAGAVNGLGIVIYGWATSSSGLALKEGALSALIFVCLVAITPVLGWAINGEPMQVRKFFGIAAAIIAVYLLRK